MPETLHTDVVERIRAHLRNAPAQMTLQIAREIGVPEVEVVRQMADRAVELDLARWEEIVRGLEAFGKVHVICSTGAATLECTGQFGNFSTWQEFFNVQTKSLDMHIRWPQLGAIFAVEKPSHMSGLNTLSIQFYDKAGHAAFKVFLTFGASAPPPETLERFQALRDNYRIP